MSWLGDFWRRFTCNHDWKPAVGEAGGYIHPRQGIFRPTFMMECSNCGKRDLRAMFVDDLDVVAVDDPQDNDKK